MDRKLYHVIICVMLIAVTSAAVTGGKCFIVYSLLSPSICSFV